ncbi:nuclear receptor-interacting protein 1 [Ictalurus punctatus]|uniref:Nuclear receptor-interacting protein 1 n=1 Tax=Ictalurus punctatus TaxID=7998 RepID=W5UK22_ICTPU|nr:nuclear receptor-interacting protein 1 [Ictalurus punctatus]XP_017346916.1 nuclear receptor-interacting protein 1 [Ictalurus punctatus]XP_017346917.1 nuclear receptor-interacting protein 1 [Ictalurus punctatus]XP_047017177.1 nuclear receptor-interacting protein 1 [Ictalurus punctatus]XP_047017178.1 nuclear receptor-interacting protein 1 [Ictalurus punctatus]XP_053543273.1 nuclear receptor-interacting protein 1 [Ictalurus punctatus]XP_053543274.1 nuclear receptor-interacting protein 1 [Icta
MTHGEETGPETHQDSAVLTYLEGLLMHRVAGAQSATATQQSEAEKGNEEQRNKETPGLTLPKHSAQQEQDKTTPQGGSTHHVKKARLLRSEVWTEHESQVRQMSMPSSELNGRKQEHCGGLNGALQCKGESTLLASLLQNFSTRLQNVALSQQIVQNLTPQKASSSGSNPNKEDKIPEHGHGSDGSGLRLAGNSTMQNNSSTQMYHHRQPSQERLSKSPGALQCSARSSSSESLHCTERLKAVASLINIRSSPAPSPKPSVACSQLALLLSSEAHLQQYSREHALKAQLAGRSASERLAAIATQQIQEKKQPTISQTNNDGLSSLQTKNGIPSQMPTSSSRQSQSLRTGQSRSVGSVRRTHPFRERRPFERHGRPSQNCSSLLLQLLNSHNTPQRLISQDHLKEDVSVFSSRGSPMFSDSEHSNSNSLPKDSSDAESTRSSCSPIDLSLKNKVNISTPLFSSSSPALDKVTESLKTRWTSESPTLKLPTEPKELHACSEIKPHHKVTLLELLLDQKHIEKTNKAPDNPDLQPKILPKVSSASTSNHALFYPGQCKDTREPSPNCRMNTRSPKLLPTFSQGRDCNIRASPYSVYNSPHTQSVPLDLCKNKPLASGSSVKEGAFSASKLLQNLAQCGKQNAASSPTPKAPLPPVKRQAEEFRTSKSSTLLEKLAVPVQKNNTPHVKSVNSLVAESTQHNSEIENLLERRTVLQLLLGNKSQKEKAGNKRKGESRKQENHSKSHNALNRTSTDLAVKTEPLEDEMCDDEKVPNQWQNKLAESHRQSPHALNQGSIKQEPLPPVAVPRDGLLCHLLHQKPRNLKPNFLAHSNQGCIKEEPVDHHQGPTIPKKRKFSVKPEDHVKVTQQRMCNSSGSQKGDSDCSTSAIPESQESSHPSSPPHADSPPAKFPPCESLRNDNSGFNVLKQLLLSDNCLKELSQSRGTFNSLERPVQNGSTIKEPCNNGELQSFHQTLNQGKSPSATAGINRVESRSDVQQDSSRSKRDLTGFVNGDKTKDCHLDSPRLTKANPILYYMLQRSNAHLVRDRVELEAKSGPRRVQIKEKDESEAFDLKVHLQQNPHHNGTHSCDSPHLNGSLKKS